MAVNRRRRSARAPATAVLERGDIYFAYRPRIDAPAARGFADVQRLYMILSPHGKRSHRLIVIGGKRLPALSGSGDRKTWGFVDKVADRAEDVEDELDPRTYLTQTRGERHVAPARPAGEGVYALVRHGEHTHLAYVLELPAKPGDVQQALNIAPEGSYIVAVKNPEAPSPQDAGLDETRRARFPKPLAERFRGRRFIAVDPPDFLDHKGAEIVLVGAGAALVEELGLELEPQHETATTAEIFRHLKLERSLHPLTPLFEGKWE
jgi:hypothetical protein